MISNITYQISKMKRYYVLLEYENKLHICMSAHRLLSLRKFKEKDLEKEFMIENLLKQF